MGTRTKKIEAARKAYYANPNARTLADWTRTTNGALLNTLSKMKGSKRPTKGSN